MFNCDSVEQARKDFPELKDDLAIEVNTLDGVLVLFTKEQLTQEDKDIFKDYTRKEIMACFKAK